MPTELEAGPERIWMLYHQDLITRYARDEVTIRLPRGAALDTLAAIAIQLREGEGGQAPISLTYRGDLTLKDTLPPPLTITDITSDMPTHPKKEYELRTLDVIEGVVIHHVGINDVVEPESIAQYCIDRRDWPGMPYHYYIRYDGSAYLTQSPDVVTYHCADVPGGYQCNTLNIGVALEGSFVGGREPNSEQIRSLRLLNEQLLRDEFLDLTPDDFKGHKEIRSTTCPGSTWHKWKHTAIPAE